MKKLSKLLILSALLITTTSCCGRHVRLAQDITPGNPSGECMDWRYGAADIKIQTTNVTSQLMNRWFAKLDAKQNPGVKPRIIITEIDNRTDMYISTDMIRDIFEGVAVNDGRFSILVGDSQNEGEMDSIMNKIQSDSKYANTSRLEPGKAKSPQFLGKIRITKSMTQSKRFDYEDYRMTVTLYDLETQEIIDSAWDVLQKRVKA